MKSQKMNLTQIQGKLNREQLKSLNGGAFANGEGCKGIIECPTLENGASCGSIENGTCKCSHRPNGDKLCL